MFCIDLCNQLFSSGHQLFPIYPSILHGRRVNYNIGHSCRHFKQVLSYLPWYHVFRNHWLLPFCSTFSDLDLGWGGHKVSSKEKLLTTFSPKVLKMYGMKFGMVMKQFGFNILILCLSEVFKWNKKNNFCFTDCSTSVILAEKKLMFACIQTVTDHFLLI